MWRLRVGFSLALSDRPTRKPAISVLVLGYFGLAVQCQPLMLGHEGFGLPLLAAAVCHWAACRGRDAFDTGAGPLRNCRDEAVLGRG